MGPKKKKGGKKGGKAKNGPPPPPKVPPITPEEVLDLANTQGTLESPIDLSLRIAKEVTLPNLIWSCYDARPAKLKVSNSGHTVILSGQWPCAVPSLTGGPLLDEYAFSQLHFHWGGDCQEGSEHTVDGVPQPLEIHAVFFNKKYPNHNEARKERNGLIALAYFANIQDEDNNNYQKIVNALPFITQANTSAYIDPVGLQFFIKDFKEDYLTYWGSVVAADCVHTILWFICRIPFGISKQQLARFRDLKDGCEKPMCRNFRRVQDLAGRAVYSVAPAKQNPNFLYPVGYDPEAAAKGAKEKGGNKGKGKKGKGGKKGKKK